MVMGLFKTAQKVKYIADGKGIDFVAEQNRAGTNIWTGRIDCTDVRSNTPYAKVFKRAIDNREYALGTVAESKNFRAEYRAACGGELMVGY